MNSILWLYHLYLKSIIDDSISFYIYIFSISNCESMNFMDSYLCFIINLNLKENLFRRLVDRASLKFIH